MTLQIEYRPLAELTSYARNTRTHSDEQVAQVAASIQEFGFTNPVLIDAGGEIIAGHGRVMAAQQLGMAEVPTITLVHLSDEQRRAYVIADNKLALNAGWDEALLAKELQELQALEYDIGLTGFDDGEVAELLAGLATAGGLTDEDDTPEADTANVVSRMGDVWQLGGHRLTCGDSTDAATVDRLLGGVSPHLMVTDPPYGVEYDPNWRNESDRANDKPYGERAVGLVENDDRANWREAWALFPGDVAYIWHADRYASNVQDSLEACGFELRCQIIWAKPRFAISRGHYHWQHEPCWYAVRKGKTGHWGGDRKQTTLWSIAHNKSETGHSTQKPVECMRRPIENNSSPGQAIYEPFSGSGTTLIAAETTGRVCYAVELNLAYVDMAVKRWQAYTGKQATLAGDGRTFDEIATERLSAAA